jgi:hypothetical protein
MIYCSATIAIQISYLSMYPFVLAVVRVIPYLGLLTGKGSMTAGFSIVLLVYIFLLTCLWCKLQ